MGAESVVDPSSEDAAPAEALLLLWELQFGTFPSAPGTKLHTWVNAIKKALLAAGEPFSLFSPVNRCQALGELPPSDHVFLPIKTPSTPTFRDAWENVVRAHGREGGVGLPWWAPRRFAKRGRSNNIDLLDVSDARPGQDSLVNPCEQAGAKRAECDRNESNDTVPICPVQDRGVYLSGEVWRQGVPRDVPCVLHRKRPRSLSLLQDTSATSIIDPLPRFGGATDRLRWILAQGADVHHMPPPCPLSFLSLCSRQHSGRGDTPGNLAQKKQPIWRRRTVAETSTRMDVRPLEARRLPGEGQRGRSLAPFSSPNCILLLIFIHSVKRNVCFSLTVRHQCVGLTTFFSYHQRYGLGFLRTPI